MIFHHFRNALLSAAANGSLSETNDKPSIPIKAAPFQQNNRLKVNFSNVQSCIYNMQDDLNYDFLGLKAQP